MLAVTGALLSVLLPAAPAAAHNSFTGSSPKDGARLATAPERIQLTFLSRVDPANTRVTVTGPAEVPASAGEPTFDGGRIFVPFEPGAAGDYTVRYEVPSSDGHPIKGEIRFTLTVGATPSAPPTPTPTPAASAPADGPSATAAAPILERAADEGGAPWWPWLLGGAVVLAVLFGGLLLLRRRAAG